ncbi:MAG: AraC family transcriptional regulator [Pyrinomonadaceae bacterium]
MIFRTKIPAFPLNHFIEALIYFDGVQHAHAVDRFLPNGDTEILIDFHDTPQFIYDNDSLKEIQACHHIWTSGVRTEPITIPSGTNSEMMVISFKKGKARAFFPFPMNEITDSVVDADLVWGTELTFLRERLLSTTDVDTRFSIAEEFLLDMFRSKLVEEPCVEYAIGEIVRRPDRTGIAQISDKIGYSKRHFIEMFRRQVGITPKAYLKIMRFQKAVEQIEAGGDIEWAAVAHDCGFYDQAHFINDFRVFSGFTPAAYLRHKSDKYLNYVPVG